MSPPRLLLDHVYDHEREWRDRIYLTQPLPGTDRCIDHTWGRCLDEARRMAAWLRGQALGDAPTIALLSKNCAHSVIAELAIWMAGGTTVALFATESPEGLRRVLEHSGAALLFVGRLDDWARQTPGVPAGLPCVALPLGPPGMLLRWEALIGASAPLPGRPGRAAHELAMLVYTSGTSGEPKGVMHDFGHVTQACEIITATIGYRPDDRMLSYLPLAHVFERAYIACASLMAGGRVFFADSPATFLADLRRARPTLFLSVPRLWEKFREGVLRQIPERPLDGLLRVPGLGPWVGRRVLARLGLAEVRMAGSGSAPARPELIAWYRALGLNLLEGYGMTEDFACSHFSRAGRERPGWVGEPFPGVAVRISPEGEVLIRSPGCMVGYHREPALTAASFTDDGFFRTGDLGERSPTGQLRLTGRLKEPFKTSTGKYVAPAPIEALLQADPMIELAVVTGAGQPAPFALVMLSESWRTRLAASGGAGASGAAERGTATAESDAARETVQRARAERLRQVNAGLAPHERLRMLVVMPGEAWSVANRLLTPTLKPRRALIERAESDQLASWFRQPGPVLWA